MTDPLPMLTALDLTARLLGFAAFVSAAQLLTVREAFASGGVLATSTLRPLTWRPSRLDATALLDGREAPLLGLTAAAAAALTVLGPRRPGGAVALAVLVGARIAVQRRCRIGGDGAEQLTTLALAAVALGTVPTPSPARAAAAVAFIGGQTCLSYLVAGVSKAASPAWRGGSALDGILATATYGHAKAGAALARVPRGSLLGGWVVIVGECAFVPMLFGPAWLAVVALAVAGAFHLGCAVVMGLDDFLRAFPATFPCVLVVAGALSPLW